MSAQLGGRHRDRVCMPWGTEVYDVNACHDIAVNTSRITVPATWAGLWYVGADMTMTSDIFDVSILVNGTTTIVVQSSNTIGCGRLGGVARHDL